MVDIAGELLVDATVQFFHLWDAIAGVQLADATTDTFRWKWTADGSFSSRSAYRSMFQGSTALAGAANIWNADAPMPYKFHAWLTRRQRCWMADRLAQHGLPSHISCPLYGIQPETLDHISLTCPYAAAVWGGVMVGAGIHLQMPAEGISEWWSQVVGELPTSMRKDANSLNHACLAVAMAGTQR
ncbi:hypothetical protein ACQ4PT_057533 [Festuca glaucescens]